MHVQYGPVAAVKPQPLPAWPLPRTVVGPRVSSLQVSLTGRRETQPPSSVCFCGLCRYPHDSARFPSPTGEERRQELSLLLVVRRLRCAEQGAANDFAPRRAGEPGGEKATMLKCPSMQVALVM